tara:strand:- start:29919 stop:30950 length:1032 start_codon:yes stop_codon:yes gene_type:complete
MEIENIIVHEVRKEEGQSVATIHPRGEENSVDEHARKLSTQLSGLFRKTGLLTGRFLVPEGPDDPQPHFVDLLENHFVSGSFNNFVSFSEAASREFKRKLDESGTSRGGYLWFNHYKFNEEHFLSVVLLRKKSGLALSDELTLDQIEQLDLDKLHMAARINLTAWLSGTSSRFIAFRVGRGAKDVTEYFSRFIGCEEYTRAKIDTQNLVQVTKRYCALNDFTDEKTEVVKQFVFQRCSSWLDDSEPVLLDNISSLLDTSFNPPNAGRFLEIAQGDPFNLSNEIPIEKRALRGLTRYYGKTKKLSLSFDSDLVNTTVFYNEVDEEIRITDVPANLKQQLTSSEM